MSQVKQCMNFFHPPDVDPPQDPVPRKSIQIISDRIYSVEGNDGKINDVLFTAFPEKARLNVIYFGGDIQNFTEFMISDRDCIKFRDKFNLETLGELLMKRFNDVHYPVHVWIIRPCRYINQKYVVYNGFLPMNNEGVPCFENSCITTEFKKFTTLPHLQALLNNSCQIENERLNSTFGNICNPNLPCSIVGFSKGCVVLSKLLIEIHLELLSNNISPFVYQIREMYWLDSSHNGEDNFWPHDYLLFSRIGNCRALRLLTFHAYATPFQIGRPIKLRSSQEFSQFTEILLKLGVQHTSGYLLRGDEINLQTHFDIIKAFPIKKH